MSTLEDLFAPLTSSSLPLPSNLNLPTLPSAPIEPISQTLSHLLSTPLHPLYPSQEVLRFGALHAVRVALAWEGMKRTAKAKRLAVTDGDGSGHGKGQEEVGVSVGAEGRVGVLGDLLGYLIAAWGGSSLVCILLSIPPPWLISSVPWLTYIPLYFLLVPSGIASTILSLIPSPLLMLGTSILDGLIRCTAIASMPTLIASSPSVPASGTLWTSTILSAIAITGGGFMIDLFGMAGSGPLGGWTIAQPGLLKGGVLGTLDAWSAAVGAVLHAAMMGNYITTTTAVSGSTTTGVNGQYSAVLRVARATMRTVLPSELLFAPYGTASPLAATGIQDKVDGVFPLVSPDTARAVIALLLMSVYLAKGLTLALLSPPSFTATRNSSASASATVSGSKKKTKKGKGGGVTVQGIELDQAEKEVLEAVVHEKAESVLQRVTKGDTQAGAGGASARSSRASTPRKVKAKA